MQRRTALKNIGLSFGALTLTPTVAGLLQSCQTAEAGWTPSFLTQEQAEVIAKVIDVMLPTTKGVPGANDLNLIQFVDGYLAKVIDTEEQEFAKMATQIFIRATLASAAKENASALNAEDIDQQLSAFLRAAPEKQAERGEALNDYFMSLEEGMAGTPPMEGVCQSFLYNLRTLAVRAFEGNAIIAKEHMVYAPVPGQQKGCVDIQEATGGKAWAL